MNLNHEHMNTKFERTTNCVQNLPCGDGIIGVPGPGGPLDTGGP